MSRTWTGSLERSVSSGTDVCIRYASSYWAMRVAISGSPNSCELDLIQLGEIVEHAAAIIRGQTPRGSTGYSTGSAAERNFTP